MRWTTVLLIGVLCVAASAFVSANRAESIDLLTVSETRNGTGAGGTARMTLQISPGTGDVFIDSYPLTQLDTQISTRFAKEVACEYTSKNCDDVNFYYTIRADSSVVGGPSAGAAAAVLTSAALQNASIDDDTVITGTVNSGGYVGPVGGVTEKLRAARRAGFDDVIIPKYSRVSNGSTITERRPSLLDGVDVHTATTIGEAYEVFTGEPHSDPASLSVPDEYNRVMENIARGLCERNEALLGNVSPSFSTDLYNETQDSRQRAQAALSDGRYYSAASYCFSANIDLREELLSDVPSSRRSLIREGVVDEAEAMLEQVQDRDISTISDVEASIIVKERLYEVLDEDVQAERSTAYLVERLDSARAWASFFNYSSSTDIDLDKDYLSEACLSKLREAEERVRYLGVIAPSVDRFDGEIEEARSSYRRGDYTYCLFQASQIKADASSIISGRSITEEDRPEYVGDKLRIAEDQISRQSRFPILGYSYYTYAASLRSDQPQLASVFAEYANEFGGLDMYFPSTGGDPVRFSSDATPVTCPVPESSGDERERRYAILFVGAVIGMLAVGIIHGIRQVWFTG